MFRAFSSILIFTLTLCFTTAYLKQDFEEIFAVLPIKDIKEVSRRFYEKDDQVRQLLNEIRDDVDIKFLVAWIKDKLIEDTDGSDLEKGQQNFKEVSNFFFDESFVKGFTPSTEIHDLGGWSAYKKTVSALLPREKLSQIIAEKFAKDEEFAKFFKLATEEYNEDQDEDQPTYRRWHLKKKLKKAWNKLKKKGVSVAWTIPF